MDSLASIDASRDALLRTGAVPSLTICGPCGARLQRRAVPEAVPVRSVRIRWFYDWFDNTVARWGEMPIGHNPDGSEAFYPVRASARDHVWKAGNL
ncbi:hypothetical protein GCM10010121_046940 [Streptomyces brasiliensis]|uniref:Uncharacterized protein n=1 Tax=Streptomyces brasiliensis TaxID=1954 RepID=A0A917KX46_9ACTN|nr:hypothetical protein GCM10010121_046940 [Streptomyces brasiliensis]